MSTQSEIQGVMLAQARFDSFGGAKFGGRLVAPLVDEIAELRQAVANENWNDVAVLATRCLGLGYGAFRILQREANTVTARVASFEAARIFLDKLFRAIAQSDFREEFVAKSRELLAANDPDLLLEMDDSLEKLKQGTTIDVPLLEDLSETMSPENLILRTPKEIAISGISRGLLGLTHAEYNLAFQEMESRVGKFTETALKDLFQAGIDEFEAALRAAQLHLYSALARNQPANIIVQTALELAGLLEERLPSFSRVQARIFLETQGLNEQGKGGAAEELGKLGMRAGFLTREAAASHAASYRLILELLDPDPAKDVENLKKRASTLGFDIKLPNGKNTTLAKLDQVQDGDFIEVEGFATSFQLVRSADGKLISRVNLLDPSSGATGCAAAVFVNLVATGVTRGAYCRVNGIYRAQSNLCQGQAGIEIDRLSLAELSKRSWRMAFLRSASSWFEPWRDGLNMCWSLGPQRLTQAGGEKNQAGAGELILLPFVRN